MNQLCRLVSRLRRRLWGFDLVLAFGLVGVVSTGCEVDSFFDPSVLGRWERTPVVLPILDQLDVIDEPETQVSGLSEVQPQDLIPVVHEYVIGPSDLITVTVFELVRPELESVQTRRVNELGAIRLPMIGTVQVDGLTPSELENRIIEILDQKGILKDATVSVIVQESRQNTFSVIGEPRMSGTAVGTYAILKTDFRLLDAMAMARGVSGAIKTLFIIRQVPLDQREQEVIKGPQPPRDEAPLPPRDPSELIDDLLRGVDETAADDPQAPQTPAGLERSLDTATDSGGHWVNIDGKWVRVEPSSPGTGDRLPAEAMVTQRIIEVPYDRLLDGDMRYNVIIRPGDVIRVPPPVIGNVYIGGAISRPGTYALPGDKDLTLKQLIFAAGNVSPLAMPERVDLIRRVDNDQEAIVRLNLRSIFEGEEPDFYLKPNDTINIGTSWVATPLAVIRNGFRMSYGFGFVLDRNFGFDVFGPTQSN